MIASNPTLAFVGAGKVGSVLARLLVLRGYTITTISSRTPDDTERLAEAVGARAVALDEVDADLVLLTVPDDMITVTAAGLMGFTGKAAIHVAGARDASALAPLAERGVQVGSLHPAYPFADVESALVGLAGSTFAVEADDDLLRGWLNGIVTALDGRVLVIPPGGKATYHAALVIASNYAVTLYALAERLLTGLGADKVNADSALDALLAGTVANIKVRGVPAGLTGPLVRADVGTIAAHLAALGTVDGEIAALYRQLAQATLPLLRQQGIDVDAIDQLLQQGTR